MLRHLKLSSENRQPTHAVRNPNTPIPPPPPSPKKSESGPSRDRGIEP
jgi:hypothetical protein